MVMHILRKSAAGGVGKFIIFGFLIMAVGGLVLMDVGGFFRKGPRITDIATVGGESISASSFDRTMRRTLSRLGIPPREAYGAGYIHQILAQEVRDRLLQRSAAEQGILISDERVTEQIRELVRPMTAPGQSAREVLSRILTTQGMSEGELVNALKRDMANALMAQALQTGFSIPDPAVARDLYRLQKQQRTVGYILFPDEDVKDIPAPSEDTLRELYEATKETYARPETRTLKLLTLQERPADTETPLTDEDLQKIYEGKSDFYRIIPSWTLEEALLPSEKEARAVHEAAQKGKSLNQALKDVTGQETAYLGERTFEENALTADIRPAVTAATQAGEILSPFESPLGWRVVVVKSITPEGIRSFEEVKTELRQEVLESRQTEERYAQAAMVDDLLASGATPEEIGREASIQITDIPPVNAFGQGPDGSDALKSAGDDRGALLETAFGLAQGESSAIMEMKDGSFTAVHVASITPKTYIPFEEVRQEIENQWTRDQRRSANRLQVADELARINTKGASLQSVATEKKYSLKTVQNLERNTPPKAPLTGAFMQQVFAAPPGRVILTELENGVALAEVTSFTWPEKVDEKSPEFQSFLSGLTDQMQGEALMLYLKKQEKEIGVSVNTQTLDTLYGPQAVEE